MHIAQFPLKVTFQISRKLLQMATTTKNEADSTTSGFIYLFITPTTTLFKNQINI